MNKPSRIEYIDAIKGFAIMLMIFGHMPIHNLNWLIYSFHMPLFFILSGFFFNPNKPILPRLKKLMVPYTITAIIILGIYLIIEFFNHINGYHQFSINEFLLKVCAYICGCTKAVSIGRFTISDAGPIWFLMALSLGYYFLWLLELLQKRLNIRRFTIIGCYVLAVLGWVLSLVFGQLPFSLNQAMEVPLFLITGAKIKNIVSQNNSTLFFTCICLWIILLYFQKEIQYMSMGVIGAIYFPIYILGSISASYLIILFFKKFNNKRVMFVFNVIGSSTLLILCLHTIDLFGVTPFLNSYLSFYSHVSYSFIILVFRCILYSLLLMFVIKKYYTKKTQITLA
ncbi:MAG: acyltransferase family protein [Clostridium sp.]|nr:acyltransferase family protein [Clostridium sp.]